MRKIIGKQLFSYYFRHIQTLEHYAYIIILIILIKKIGNVKGGIVGTTVLQVDQPHFTGVRHHLDFDHPCLTIISRVSSQLSKLAGGLMITIGNTIECHRLYRNVINSEMRSFNSNFHFHDILVMIITMLAGMASLWEKTIGLELSPRLDSIKEI